MQSHRLVLDHPALLRFARALSDLGAPLTVDILAVVAAGALLALRRPRAAGYVLLVRAATELLDVAVKAAVARPRPSFADPVAHAAGFGFPSGHAAGAASLYLPLAVVVGVRVASAAVRRTVYALAALICLAVATTRVLLGVHYPSDVLAGLALGAAVTTASRLVLPPASA